ncbi:MAG TPA: cytidylate kinase-like family protein [Usitatibacteraceae bacterium]|nr:cytidylate kinase-like family protein [Usitatibacteraceae bacterium]
MPVVAMTREMGSLGKDVASGLSEALGVPLIYHELIDVLADKMRVRKSHVMRLLDGQANIFERMSADTTSLSIFTAAEVCSKAAAGNGAIFRGWGAVHIMREVPQVLCLRVCAPMDIRLQRMKERLKTDDQALVQEEIRASDEAQTALVRRVFHADWKDAEHYDMVLNTERVPVDACVEQVLGLLRTAPFAETDASRQALADLALKAAVVAALRSDPRTRKVDVKISAALGQVKLEGMVETREELELSEQVAAAVPGALGVLNQLRAVADMRRRYG